MIAIPKPTVLQVVVLLPQKRFICRYFCYECDAENMVNFDHSWKDGALQLEALHEPECRACGHVHDLEQLVKDGAREE